METGSGRGEGEEDEEECGRAEERKVRNEGGSRYDCIS